MELFSCFTSSLLSNKLGFWRSVFLVYSKDSKSEWRNPIGFLSPLLFAAVLAAVYSYALKPGVFAELQNFEAMLLTALFFSSTLSVYSSANFRSEREAGALRIMNMSFLDPMGLYLAKLLFHWQKQLVFIALCLPIYSLFLLGNIELSRETYFSLFVCLALSALGLSALATLMAYLALTEGNFKANANANAALLPLLFFPAAIPLLLFALNFLTESRQKTSWQDIALIHYLLLIAPACLYASLGSLFYIQLSFEEV